MNGFMRGCGGGGGIGWERAGSGDGGLREGGDGEHQGTELFGQQVQL